MTYKLDHIVIAVHRLEEAIADYRALGFNVLPGGDHPGRNTHNALVVFADGSYLELIAWKSPSPQERWWQLLQRHGEGIVDYALLPADTTRAVAEAALRGLRLEGPIEGGRLRPDGERLRWQIARPPSPDLPFLCGDVTPRALRVPEGAARIHPNEVQGIASVAIAVADIEASLRRLRALLGEPATAIGAPVSLPGLRSRLALADLGGSILVLSASRAVPASEEHEPSAADPVGLRLALRGEGPYALVLRTASGRSVGSLDPGRSHGAFIEVDGAAAAGAAAGVLGDTPVKA